MVRRRPVKEAPLLADHDAGLAAEIAEVLLEAPVAQELPQDLIRFGAPRNPLMQQQEHVGDGRRVQIQDLQGLAPEVRSGSPIPPLDLRPLECQEGPDAVAARSVEVPELLLEPEGADLPERCEGHVRRREPLEGAHRRLRRVSHRGVCGGTGGQPEGWGGVGRPEGTGCARVLDV